MKRFLIVLVALCLSSWSMAQTDLPACQGPDTIKWDQCIGSETFNVDGKMVSRYVGEYASGSFNGQGAMTFASGLRFVGNFKAGLRNGEGVEYKKDGGLLRSGTWEGPLSKTWPVEISRYPFDWEASLTSTLAAAGNKEASSLNLSSLVPGNNLPLPDINKCPANFRLTFEDASQGCLTDFAIADAFLTGTKESLKSSLNHTHLVGSLHITIGNASCPALAAFGGNTSIGVLDRQLRQSFARRDSKSRCQRLLSERGIQENPDCLCSELIADGRVASTQEGLRDVGVRWARQLSQPLPMAAAAPPASPVAAPITPPNLPVTGQAQNQKMAQELAQLEQRLQQDRSERLREAADATQAKRELEERLKSEAALRQQERQARESSEQKIRQEQAERDRLAAENARLRAELEAARQTSVRPNVAFRKALVIGIDNYKHVSRLATAREDAQAMASALKTAGFTVSQYLDIGEKDMRAALRKFASEVEGGDEVAFFFAGHGVQLSGLNYLIPMDVSGESEGQLREDAIPLQRILDDMNDRKAKLTLAVIDACRDNPFRVAGRNIGNVSRGLSPTTPATGQIVIFSAGTGQRALDTLGPQDKDRNGVFTRVFSQEIRKRGIPIDQVARSARTEVVRLARSIGHEQVPAIYDQLVGEFILMK
jgi:hypothetical protein